MFNPKIVSIDVAWDRAGKKEEVRLRVQHPEIRGGKRGGGGDDLHDLLPVQRKKKSHIGCRITVDGTVREEEKGREKKKRGKGRRPDFPSTVIRQKTRTYVGGRKRRGRRGQDASSISWGGSRVSIFAVGTGKKKGGGLELQRSSIPAPALAGE